jgi:hypothetical protein
MFDEQKISTLNDMQKIQDEEIALFWYLISATFTYHLKITIYMSNL